MKKVFCISGITGQDGSYAAEILLKINIPVIGLTRNISKKYKNLSNIKSNKNLKLVQSDYSEESLNEVIIKYQVTHFINFTGQSYVSKSWLFMEETIKSQSLIVSRILNIIKNSQWKIKLINLCSSEIFKESKNRLKESSAKSPCNPYGCAQLLSFELIKAVRNISNVWACNAICFPHESNRRAKDFLFMRVIEQVEKIIEKGEGTITIGNDYVIRDWGFAVDYIYYVLLMISKDKPQDLCLCTGEGNSVKDLVIKISEEYDLDCKNILNFDKSLSRSYEPDFIVGDNSKLIKDLEIDPPKTMDEMIKMIIRNRLNNKVNKLDKIEEYISLNKLEILKNSLME